MTSSYYNPEQQPVAAEWLALSEAERLRVVFNFHVAPPARMSGARQHAASHVVVENQIANGFGPSRRAILRLQGQGLTRHQAIHAVAAVVWRCLSENPFGPAAVSAKVMQTRMNQELDALSADTPAA